MKKILILGGGFGGIRTALDLDKRLRGRVEITLLDKNSYHLFTPSLYEVASAYGTNPPAGGDPFAVKLRKTVCVPYREIFTGKSINFIQTEISAVDLKLKSVKTSGGEILVYDYLVIGLGSQTADFGIPGVSEYAYKFKSIEDALAINAKIEKLIKKMTSGEKMDSLKILIGGAGFSGIEFAAEISGCVKKMCLNNKVKTINATMILIESGHKILPMVSDKEREIISKHLTKLGVILMEGSPIAEIGDGFVKLRNGQSMEGDMVVWTAGIKANDFLKSIDGLLLTDKGKIIVDENLQVKEWKNVFAVGDNQEFIDPKTQKPVPGMAYTSIEQGKVVARNIFNILNDKNLRKYKPAYAVWVAPVGGKFALAKLGYGLHVDGFVGWVVRELVDLRYLISILSFSKAITLFGQEIVMFAKND